MHDGVPPVHELHSLRATRDPFQFTPEVRFGSEGRKAEGQA